MQKLQSIKVINELDGNVDVRAQFQSGTIETRTLRGINAYFTLGRSQMQGKYSKNFLIKLVFLHKNRTDQMIVDDIQGQNQKRVYRIDEDFNIKYKKY